MVSCCKLVLILLILDTTTSQAVLLATDFKAQSFNTAQDWSVAFGSVGYTTVDAQSFFGGNNHFSETTQIQKIFVLPPHYRIRILASIYLSGQWNNGNIKLLCDERSMFAKQLYSMQNPYYKQTTKINVITLHNARTAVISIRPSIQQQYTQSWGLRDFELHYYPCPNGCLVCSQTDSSSTSCSQWIQSFSQFISTNMNHEGWLNNNDINYWFNDCNGLPVFGFYNAGQSLKRTFYLKPHNRIRIQFLFVKLNDWGQSTFQFLIDNIIQHEIKDTTDQLHNINYCDSNTGLDSVQRIDIEFPHSTQLSEFLMQTSLSQNALFNSFGIRDFTIYIQCDNCQQNQQIIFQPNPITYFTSDSFTNVGTWDVKIQKDQTSLFNCTNSSTIFGLFGQGQHIYRTFTLKPHRWLTISFVVFCIDSWDHETLYVDIDGFRELQVIKDVWETANNYLCQNIWPEKLVPFYQNIPHSKKTITIDIYSDMTESNNLNPDLWNESFGLRDFLIKLGDCPFDCTACNDVTGDYCSYKYWVEHLSLNQQWFQDGGGWSSPFFTDAPNQITQCDSKTILGGQIGHKGYLQFTQSFVAHDKIRVIFNLYIIGDWINDKILITINNKEFYNKQITTHQTNILCSSQKAFIIQIDEVIDHSQSNFIIKITNEIPLFPEDNRQFGIRDFYLYYQTI